MHGGKHPIRGGKIWCTEEKCVSMASQMLQRFLSILRISTVYQTCGFLYLWSHVGLFLMGSPFSKSSPQQFRPPHCLWDSRSAADASWSVIALISHCVSRTIAQRFGVNSWDTCSILFNNIHPCVVMLMLIQATVLLCWGHDIGPSTTMGYHRLFQKTISQDVSLSFDGHTMQLLENAKNISKRNSTRVMIASMSLSSLGVWDH